MQQYAWEAAQPDLGPVFGEHVGADNVEEEIDYDKVSADDAGKYLVEFIIDLKQQGILSAKRACLICFWAMKAGACGAVADLARPPGKQSGKYSLHFDRICGKPSAQNFHYLKMPGHRRVDDERCIHRLPARLLHEVAAKDISDNPERRQQLQAALDADTLPRTYHTHPIVLDRSEGEAVYPYAIYIDGVGYARTDTCIGFWFICLLTGRRWLLVVLRKADICKCGCRGWCSFFIVFKMLSWCIAALAQGLFPLFDEYGQPLTGERLARAGLSLSCKGAILFVKGDWAEYAATVGFPNWNSLLNPCPLCDVTQERFVSLQGFNALDFPFRKKGWQHYQDACVACEIRICPLSPELWRKLRASLAYDKRLGAIGAHGRALQVDLPEHGLLKGDRLEPCDACPDIGAGFDATNPGEVTFWRNSAVTATLHRNPLFSEATGVTPDRVLVVDWLHTGPLGVVGYFLAALTGRLIHADAWCSGRDSKHERLQMSALKLRSELFAWYATESAAGRQHCRAQDLTWGMLGSADDPKLKLHAAEMMGFLYFAATLIDRFGAILGPAKIECVRVRDSLQRIHEVLKKNPMGCPPRDVQALVDSCRTALRGMSALDIKPRFKMHALMHLTHDAAFKGSPSLWATWTDESLNRLLKSVSLAAHCRRDVWAERVLDSVQSCLERQNRKRKN